MKAVPGLFKRRKRPNWTIKTTGAIIKETCQILGFSAMWSYCGKGPNWIESFPKLIFIRLLINHFVLHDMHAISTNLHIGAKGENELPIHDFLLQKRPPTPSPFNACGVNKHADHEHQAVPLHSRVFRGAVYKGGFLLEAFFWFWAKMSHAFPFLSQITTLKCSKRSNNIKTSNNWWLMFSLKIQQWNSHKP